MFNATKVQDGLLGLVGIRQPFNPTYAVLDAENTSSRSGRYLDDIPQYKTEFYIDTQNYKDINPFDVNDGLRNIQRGAISSVCSSVFGDNSYIDRNYIYSHASTRVTPESTLVNGFVGYKIVPSNKKNLGFKITNIRLEFQGAGDVKVVLFNSNVNAPIQEQTITITSNDQTEALNWEIDSTDGDYKGEYYLGYIYDGSLIPYKRDYSSSNVMNGFSELCIEKVRVSGAVDTTIFDLADVYGLSENTGLNPDITVYDDYTDLILNNDNLLAHAVQLQWAINVMNVYISSARSNRTERITKEVMAMTIQQIEGSAFNAPIRVTGLSSLLNSEVQKLTQTFRDLKDGYFGSGIQVITAN